MSRRVVLVLVIAILAVVGAVAAMTVSARSMLDRDRDTVDARWAPLRQPLATRYDGLDHLVAALAAAGGADRTYTADLRDELVTWKRLAEPGNADPGAEAGAANALEGLAVRVRTNVAHSARLDRDQGVKDAFAAFDAALVPNDAVKAYNRAARRYQSTRTDTLKRLPAELLGFGARPVLVVGSSPTG